MRFDTSAWKVEQFNLCVVLFKISYTLGLYVSWSLLLVAQKDSKNHRVFINNIQVVVLYLVGVVHITQ